MSSCDHSLFSAVPLEFQLVVPLGDFGCDGHAKERHHPMAEVIIVEALSFDKTKCIKMSQKKCQRDLTVVSDIYIYSWLLFNSHVKSYKIWEPYGTVAGAPTKLSSDAKKELSVVARGLGLPSKNVSTRGL